MLPSLTTKLKKLLNGEAPAHGAPLGMVSKDVLLGDRLDQAVVESPSNEIADPGTGGTIAVTKSGLCAMTSTAPAQARALPNPTFIGQEVQLLHAVDGGSLVVTAAGPINQTGNTVMTLAEVNDWIVLKGVELAGGVMRWRVLANDGVALS